MSGEFLSNSELCLEDLIKECCYYLGFRIEGVNILKELQSIQRVLGQEQFHDKFNHIKLCVSDGLIIIKNLIGKLENAYSLDGFFKSLEKKNNLNELLASFEQVEKNITPFLFEPFSNNLAEILDKEYYLTKQFNEFFLSELNARSQTALNNLSLGLDSHWRNANSCLIKCLIEYRKSGNSSDSVNKSLENVVTTLEDYLLLMKKYKGTKYFPKFYRSNYGEFLKAAVTRIDEINRVLRKQ